MNRTVSPIHHKKRWISSDYPLRSLRHVLGWNNTNTVNNSNRPAHINNEVYNSENHLRPAHVVVGPNAPNAGPVLPNAAKIRDRIVSSE